VSMIGARFGPNILEAWKSFWMHRMEVPGDMGHVESCFSPFGDSVSVGARYWHGLRQMYQRLRNIFGRAQ
jgi:hypothetical protein